MVVCIFMYLRSNAMRLHCDACDIFFTEPLQPLIVGRYYTLWAKAKIADKFRVCWAHTHKNIVILISTNSFHLTRGLDFVYAGT